MHYLRTLASALLGSALLLSAIEPARADGPMLSSGSNENGQLCTFSNIFGSNVPVPVFEIQGKTVAAGLEHTLILRGDGTVWTCGWNFYGQLGNGTNINGSTPTQLTGLTGMSAVAGGDFHSLALKSDGAVWAWGANDQGQLGNGTNINSNVPVQVAGLTGVTAISAGGFHSLALKGDGTVWAWGDDFYGQLGNGVNGQLGQPVTSNVPVQVIGLTNATAVTAGNLFSLALKSDGTVSAWGFNGFGQLGDGTQVQTNLPVPVIGLTGVTSIAAGNMHSIAVRNDGAVWDWGWNASGQLGIGTSLLFSAVPLQVLGLSGVTTVVAGTRYSMALKSSGSVWAWGQNNNGQFGVGNDITTLLPVQTGYLLASSIAAGGMHSLVVQLTPEDAINNLIDRVAAAGLSHGESNSLTAKLRAALGDAQAGNSAGATGVLGAFINEVNAAVKSGRLTSATGSLLISGADTIIGLL